MTSLDNSGAPILKTTNDGSEAKPDWTYLWDTCTILPAVMPELKSVCATALANKDQYLQVQAATGCPWYLVAGIHYREASMNFNTYLGNGDPLHAKSVHVPRGRGSFATWYEGAIDALKFDGIDHFKFPDAYACLIFAEKYNGLGYRARGEYSPYVWGGTNHQEPGKYVADGQFDPNAVDHRPGVAAIMKYLTSVTN